MSYLDDWRHYDENGDLTAEGEAAALLCRADSDAGDFISEAYAEDYDRDWRDAIADHDWFCNRCTEQDQFGARCRMRHGHEHRHDASANGFLKFLYSEEKIQALVYESNPLLAMVAR